MILYRSVISVGKEYYQIRIQKFTLNYVKTSNEIVRINKLAEILKVITISDYFYELFFSRRNVNFVKVVTNSLFGAQQTMLNSK